MDKHDNHDMHPARAVSRRQLLVLGAIALTAAAIPASLALVQRDGDNLSSNLLGLLNDPDSAAELGERWLIATHAHPSIEGLSQKINKRLHPNGWSPLTPAEDAHAILAEHVRNDFLRKDIVEIEGWQLSRTEAELCILAALMLHPARAEEAPAREAPTTAHPT